MLLARPNALPWTAVRPVKIVHRWHDVVVFSRVVDGREVRQSYDRYRLMLVRRGSDR